MNLNRVVITGTGAVSPFGNKVEALSEGIFANRSGIINIGSIWRESVADILCEVGGVITADLNEKKIPRDLRRNMGRVSILACLAAEEAVNMAGLTEAQFTSGDYGISFASTTGSSQSMIDFTARFIREKAFLQSNRDSSFKLCPIQPRRTLPLSLMLKEGFCHPTAPVLRRPSPLDWHMKP